MLKSNVENQNSKQGKQVDLACSWFLCVLSLLAAGGWLAGRWVPQPREPA
jgi:hypothetical protein